ncbi:protein of unknown function [Methylocaldum szegediense]|uniref:Uncharacterized protein n=1 Tax=Methylocaldum szegediense TaxID=73780 RepID=A0ABN8X0Q6_9GAMM|nr:protein of unknown function [Methylocaldum szegediense]
MNRSVRRFPERTRLIHGDDRCVQFLAIGVSLGLIDNSPELGLQLAGGGFHLAGGGAKAIHSKTGVGFRLT